MRHLSIFTRNIVVVLQISSCLDCTSSITYYTLDPQPTRETGPIQYSTQANSEANSHVIHMHRKTP